jgi:putative transposase
VIYVNDELAEAIALHRWAVIAEATNPRLSHAERGALVRAIAARVHSHPDGSQRCYGRSTLDGWIRDWRAGGLAGLRPKPRSDSGLVRNRPELFEEAAALRLELPARSAAVISDILWQRHGVRIPQRTVSHQLRRRGLHREALAAEPKVFGRYEAERPNERWITDVLVGPWVPHPRVGSSVRARLFVIVDDHSRLLVHGRFHRVENARAGQEVLRAAILRRGLPEILYADNGAPFSNRALDRSCAVLGIRLVHSKPYSPEGRGKQERLNRYIRERFIAEAEHIGIEELAELNDRFEAWAEQIANRRTHAETGQSPLERWGAGGPPRAVDLARLREAFRWATARRVTRTATVALEGNTYSVDPALAGRRVELRYEPEELSVIEVYFEGRPAGAAIPFVIGRHVAKAVPQAFPSVPEPTGVDYLGLVAAAHDAEIVGSISYAHMNFPANGATDDTDDPENSGDEEQP